MPLVLDENIQVSVGAQKNQGTDRADYADTMRKHNEARERTKRRGCRTLLQILVGHRHDASQLHKHGVAD